MCTDVYGGGALGAVCAMCCEILKAHGCVVCWLAGHIAQSRYCERGNTDEYRRIRTFTDYGHMVQCVPCAVKFQKHMALRQPCANCPLCPLCPSCPFSLPALHSSVRSGGGPPLYALHNVPRQPTEHNRPALCQRPGQQTSSRMAATSRSLKSTGLHFMLPERQLRMMKS